MTDIVFIHSGFRTGSSWLWSKFRKGGQWLAFGEIFHEYLATLDGQTAGSLSHKSWNSRHPVTAPYFAEFMPLLNPNGGIKGFSEELAFDLYFPRGERLSDPERTYIQLLLDHAAKLGKIPVLSCTRTLGRVRQIKRDFGGVHILLTRDPFRQWCSYTEQAALGNPYFLNTNARILKSAREADWFQFGEDQHDEQDFLALDAFYRHALLHFKLYGEVAGEADVIIDYDLLDSETYRQEIGRQIRSKCGTDVDLSDFKSSKQFSLVDLPSVGVVDEMLQSFLPSREQMHPDVLTIYEAMQSSMASYADEAGELVRFSRGKLTELQTARSELESAALRSSQASGELERSSAELHELRGQLEREHADLADARGQVAALGNELQTTAAEREAIRAQLVPVQAELQATLGQLERALSDGQDARALLEDTRNALAGSTRDHLASVERLCNERRLGEEALRREFGALAESLRAAVLKAQGGEAAARAELARSDEIASALQADVRELRIMLQTIQSQSEHRHRESDAALAEANAALDRTRAEAGQKLHEIEEALAQATIALKHSHDEATRQSQERDAIIARANTLIRAVVAERPDPWVRIGLALRLARPSSARMALAAWTDSPSGLVAESLSDHATRQPTETHMSAPPLLQDMNPYLRADSLAELLSWDDVNFVRCAYVTVLGRQPDPEGEAFYTNRLRRGHSKLDVLWQLRRSNEGPNHDPGIAGLDRALKKARWDRNSVVGWVVRSFTGGEGDSAGWRRHRALLNSAALMQMELARHAHSIEGIDAKLDQLKEKLSRPVELAPAHSESVGGPEERPAEAPPTTFQPDPDLDSRARYALQLLQLEAKAV